MGIFGGVIVDCFGVKLMIVIGMLMCVVGFVIMGIVYELWLLWFLCLFLGFGGMLFDLLCLVLVVKLICL